MHPGIGNLRRDYSQKALLETEIKTDPFQQFDIWWQEVLASEIIEPNAMTLATASADGLPAARIVLLKAYSAQGFVFFTNYNSFKGKQLNENPKACLVFFWKELERQVRITGFAKKISEKESDEYFYSRPLASQLGAVISPQSQVIESREWLQDQFSQAEKATLEETPVLRPAHWGGYIITPVIMEFWQGRPGRLHDRLEYSLTDSGQWKVERLAP
jgi:pyridoxamine 5'-phosphate oxidase